MVIIWDKRRDESFKERLESDRSKSELRKQRELSYEQKVQQRNRLAEEISLERQLRFVFLLEFFLINEHTAFHMLVFVTRFYCSIEANLPFCDVRILFEIRVNSRSGYYVEAT